MTDEMWSQWKQAIKDMASCLTATDMAGCITEAYKEMIKDGIRPLTRYHVLISALPENIEV
jgi:hypothetical protein